MWRKNKKCTREHYEAPKKPEQVKCEECKHWIDKVDAQEISNASSHLLGSEQDALYYCLMHTKKYDKVSYRYDLKGKFVGIIGHAISPIYLKRIPEQWIEVDENGKKIKSRKSIK